MTSGTSGAAQRPTQSRSFTSSPVSFQGVDFFLDKIQWVYGLCMATIASFCIYNLVRGCQLLRNSSIQFSKEFCPARCQILLAEIDEKLKTDASADIRSPLQSCNTLLSSMSLTEQQKFLPKLITHYSKIDSNYAYELARRLLGSFDIFNATQCLKDSASPPSQEKLLQLYKKGYKLHSISGHVTSLDLEYAEAFHSLKDDQLKNQALSLAWNWVDKHQKEASELYRVCSIAFLYEKFQDTEQVKKTLEKALEISKQIPLSAHSAQEALLTVADFFFDFKDYEKMQTVLDRLFADEKENQSITCAIKKLKLAGKISAEPSALMPPQLKNFSEKTSLDQLFKDLQSTPSKEVAQKARDYKELASGYLHFKMYDKAHEALAYAVSTTETIPIEVKDDCNEETKKAITEAKIRIKLELLQYFSCYDSVRQLPDDTAQKLLEQLRQLYTAAASHNPYLKNEIGLALIKFCNRKNQIQVSDETFQQYLADHLNHEDAAGKITSLTGDALSMDGLFDSGLSTEQYQLMLEAAERLLPQVPSHSQTSMISRISQGYLKIDSQKSLEILNKYASKRTTNQGIQHLTDGAITAIVLGVLYVYPQVGGPLLTLCGGLYSLYRT